MSKSITILALSAALLFGSAQPTHAAGGWLGIQPEQPTGIQVGDIIKGSPADISGLMRGDVILQLNAKKLVNVSQFSMEIYSLNPGTEVTLTFQRNGETKTIKTKLESVEGHSFYMHNMNIARMANHKPPLAFNRTPVPPKQPGMWNVGLGHTHDYQTRLNSARSMLEAFERIADEKQLGDKGKQTSSEILGMLDQAQKLFEKYQINEGMSLLGRAYKMTKQALIQLRGGETLYKTLNFPTPESEYVYEIGRNNVFQMLLERALNNQKIPPDSTNKIEEARTLRGKADGNAMKNAFKLGIEQLEQSTVILTELLRKTGLDIPQ